MVRLVAATILCAVAVWSCGQDNQQVKRPPNEMIIGVAPDYPPFEYADSALGQTVGFDIELIQLICQANRWNSKLVLIEFGDLLDALNRGDIDIAISAITITPAREALVVFSDPYFITGQSLVVPAGESSITGMTDMPGKRVGVMIETTAEQLTKNVDGALVYPYESISTALADLAASRLDAVVSDRPTMRELLKTMPLLKLLAGTLNSEYYGIAMRSGDTLRMQALNDALAGLVGGYTYERLHQKWLGYPPLDVEVPDSVVAMWDRE